MLKLYSLLWGSGQWSSMAVSVPWSDAYFCLLLWFLFLTTNAINRILGLSVKPEEQTTTDISLCTAMCLQVKGGKPSSIGKNKVSQLVLQR